MRIIADEVGQHGGAKKTRLEELYLNMVNRKSPFPDEEFRELIELLHVDIEKNIDDLDDTKIHEITNKDMLKADVATFFDTIDRSDTNYVGVANVIGMQCVILFTEACIPLKIEGKVVKTKITNVKNSDDDDGGEPIQKFYDFLLGDHSNEWKNYTVMRTRIQDPMAGPDINGLYFQYSEVDGVRSIGDTTKIFIISRFNFNASSIIEQYLDNVFFCGLGFAYEPADGNIYHPYNFVYHDMLHAGIYLFNVMAFEYKGSHVVENLKDFYEFIKNKRYTSKELYKRKLVLYNAIHESSLKELFPYESAKDSPYNTVNGIYNAYVPGQYEQSNTRFVSKEDMFSAIPDEIRKRCKFREPEISYIDTLGVQRQSTYVTDDTIDLVYDFVRDCFEKYEADLREWWTAKQASSSEAPPSAGGGRKRKQKTRKTRKHTNKRRRNRRKTRR